MERFIFLPLGFVGPVFLLDAVMNDCGSLRDSSSNVKDARLKIRRPLQTQNQLQRQQLPGSVKPNRPLQIQRQLQRRYVAFAKRMATEFMQ
jgi:hypothetical protein